MCVGCGTGGCESGPADSSHYIYTRQHQPQPPGGQWAMQEDALSLCTTDLSPTKQANILPIPHPIPPTLLNPMVLIPIWDTDGSS